MRVHIVYRDDGHIIPKMMRWLVGRLDWSMGEYTDNSADVNYFAPYLAMGTFRWPSTKTAGWFTHYEPGNLGKMALWESAKKMFNLRLITAPMYARELERFGLVRWIKPGIDLELFRLPPKTKKRKGVGVAAVASPRKGPKLVQALADSKIPLSVVGKGWDKYIQESWSYIPDADMPVFYGALDVYVCTSIVEGIPIPPLEAMACGCKLVAPRGVGMLDMLAGSEGVFYYDAGNVDSMLVTVAEALETNVKPSVCREAVEGYSIEAWCESHEANMQEVLG